MRAMTSNATDYSVRGFGSALVKPLVMLAFLFSLAGCGAQTGSPSNTTAAPERGSRYPIVLHHGFLGFNKILSIDYFYRVPQLLSADGFTVRTTRVAPVNTIAYRARQLAEQIDTVLAETGAAKVNIIAHSMGGLDARYLISTLGYGDRVAALVTVSTPHRGTAIADVANRITDPSGALVRNALGELMAGDAADDEADAGSFDLPGAIYNLTTRFAKDEFNPANPDDDRVVYESWAGHSLFTGMSGRDLIDAVLLPLYTFLRFNSGDNDGLVPVESAWHGVSRGMQGADHVDEIGQLFGKTSRNFNYRTFYRNIALDLAARGF